MSVSTKPYWQHRRVFNAVSRLTPDSVSQLAETITAVRRGTVEFFNTFKPMYGLVRVNGVYLSVLTVFSVLGAVLVLGDVLVVGAIIDNLVNGSDLSIHLFLFALLTLFIVARHALVFVENGVSFFMQTRLSLRLRGKLFGSLLTRSNQDTPTRNIGELVQIETASLSTVQSHITDDLTDLINAILMLIVAIGLMIQFSARLAAGFAVLATVWFVVSLFFYPLAEKYSRQVHNVTSKSRLHFIDGISNSKLVNNLGIVALMVQQYLQQLLRESIVAGRVLRFNLWQDLYSSLLPVLLVLMSYAFGGMMVIQHEITVGQMVAFNLICSRAIMPLNRLLDIVMGFSSLKVASEKLFAELDLSHPLVLQRGEVSTNRPPPATLTVNTLSKRYADKAVLHDIDLRLNAGELMVVEGVSGSGKSTLLELLAGNTTPDSGSVHYGSTTVAEMLRRDVQLVTADPEFFVGTVADNLLIAVAERPDKTLIDCCLHTAECEHFVGKDQSGLEKILDDDETLFSRGELQRLALCRSLLLQPRLLLLDESLSGLGQSQALSIVTNVRKLWPTMTIVVASHRNELNTIADQRLLLN